MEIFETEQAAVAAAMKIGGGEYQFNSCSNRDYRYPVVSTVSSKHSTLLMYGVYGKENTILLYAVVPLGAPQEPVMEFAIDIGRGEDEERLKNYADGSRWHCEEGHWSVNMGGGGKSYYVYDRLLLEEHNAKKKEYEENIKEAVDDFMSCVGQVLVKKKTSSSSELEDWYKEDILIRRQSTWLERLLRLFR
jgi:hypothetical protein